MPGFIFENEMKFNRKNINFIYWHIINDFGKIKFNYTVRERYEKVHYPFKILFLSKKKTSKLHLFKSFEYIETISRISDKRYLKYLKQVVKFISDNYKMNYKLPKFIKNENGKETEPGT